MPKPGWPSSKDVLKATNPHYRGATKSPVGGTARTVGSPTIKRPTTAGRLPRGTVMYGGD